MIKYLKVADENTAALISESLYTLTINPNWGCESKYLLAWSQDVNGDWYIHWDLEARLPINPDRNKNMDAVLSQFVQLGLVTQQSAATITEIVRENQPITLAEITPVEWVLADSIESPILELEPA